MRTLVCSAAVAAIAMAPSSAAAEPLVPTANWLVDFADARCTASRSYGKETLAFKASPMGDVVQLMLLEPAAYIPTQQVTGDVRSDTGTAMPVTALRWSTAVKPSQRMTMVNLTVAQFEQLTAGTMLSAKLGSLSRSYRIGGMSGLRKVMKECVDDLQKVWSPPEGGSASRATTNLAGFFSDDDYPAEAALKQVAGTTAVSLLITEQGRVADCMVTQTSGQAILDVQTCAIITRRARFKPARDAQGRPTRDRTTSRIQWRLPD